MSYKSLLINENHVHLTTWTTSTRVCVTEHAEVNINGQYYNAIDKWYNRPWYEYTYQNALISAARCAYNDAYDVLKCEHMKTREWKKLTSARREELEPIITATMHNTPAEIVLYLIKNHYTLSRAAGYREISILTDCAMIVSETTEDHDLLWFYAYDNSKHCAWDRNTNQFIN